MVQTRNPRTLVTAEVVAFGGGDDGEEMMMMALGGVGWQQWWCRWRGEAAAVDAPVMRMASAAAKTCQGDSLEFYLITGSIYTNQRGTVVIATVFNE
ncbi:hypothetical protein Tco_0892756, partial [Tanacetum coccineum]